MNICIYMDFSGDSVVKNPRVPHSFETRVQSLGGEGPLEKEMMSFTSILAWEIPQTEGLQPMGSQESGA